MTNKAESAAREVLLVVVGGAEEATVSVLTAVNLLPELLEFAPECELIFLDEDSRFWHLQQSDLAIATDSMNFDTETLKHTSAQLLLSGAGRLELCVGASKLPICAVLPLVHGRFGEDGALQGLCRVAGVKCYGPTLTGAVLSYDKRVQKALCRAAGLPVVNYRYLRTPAEITDLSEADLGLRFPLIVKPNSLGSSVGVSTCMDFASLTSLEDSPLPFSNGLLLEECVAGVELECYVYRTEAGVECSLVGGTDLHGALYDFDAKYITRGLTNNVEFADVPEGVRNSARQLAIETYRQLQGHGFCRVDLFWCEGDVLYINELNSIPGMFSTQGNGETLFAAAGFNGRRVVDLMTEFHDVGD